MRLSDKGKKLLMEWEGFKTEIYKDSAGLKTIGVGHLLTQDELAFYEVALDDGSRVNFHDGLTDEQVLSLLARDVRRFEKAVTDAVTSGLTQDQFDALVSLCFNIGVSAFRGSTLLKVLNQGRFDDVPSELRKWTKAGGQIVQGLVNRREKEIALWNGDT